MDHLPYPTKASLPPLRIPYLCEEVERYDGLGLTSFPLRAGWLSGSHSSPWYACHASARAQSWLYYGLLQELFGRAFHEQEFLDTALIEQQFVTSARLPVLLNGWCPLPDGFNAPSASREPTETNLGRTQPVRYRTDSYERLVEILDFVEEQSDVVDAEIPSARLIVLSIKILIWSVRNSLFHHRPSLKKTKNKRLRQSRLLKSRMLEGGKCPYWTELYLQRYSPALIYYLAAAQAPSESVNSVACYLAATQPPGATLDPLDFPSARYTGEFISTVDTITHTRCSTEKCIASDIDELHYTTKHVWGDCDCIFVTANVGKVVEIIQNGCVPLVEINELPTGLLVLDVVQASHDVHYTAISHVWSGGLGNPTSNGLPQCQLRRLRRSLAGARRRARTDASVSRPTANFCGIRAGANDQGSKFQREIFWMDTFCIPVSLGKQLRRKAIAQMNFIYAGADNVLVVDPELQLAMWNGFSPLELRVQLLFSAWMTRCWTYQEARLARVWLIDVTTHLYDPIHTLWDEILLQKPPTGVDESVLEREAISVCEGLWPLSLPRFELFTSATLPSDDVVEFARIWCQLNERSTSHSADRLIILSILRDLSVAEIQSIGLKQRMQAILYNEDSLPLSLLFQTQQGPVVDDDKCRWVPLYPSGWMSTDYGCMVKSSDKDYFTLSLSAINARGYLMNAKDSANDRFYIANETQGLPTLFEAWIEAITHVSVAPRTPPRMACVLLSPQPADFRDSQYRLAGARFYVEDVSSDSNFYTLVYDCPLVYTRTRPVAIETSSACNEYPRIEVSLLSERAKILLDCDLPSWYQLRHSRTKHTGTRRIMGVQSPPYVEIGGWLITVFWAVSLGVGEVVYHNNHKRDPDSYPLTPLPMALLTLGAILARSSLFSLLESTILFDANGEWQYREWASTFNNADGPATVSFSRSSETFSYQYQPTWLAGVIVFIALLLLVIGLRMKVMAWTGMVGGVILGETILRIVVELLWLRTAFGTTVKSLFLRWLPWFSLPARRH